MVPIIVWLASDEGKVSNGRVYGVTGHKITLFSEPLQERVLYSKTPFFDIDRLFEEWPNTLGQGGYPMNRMVTSASQVVANAPGR